MTRLVGYPFSQPCKSVLFSTHSYSRTQGPGSVKVGRDLITKVTDAVMDDVRAWAQRRLEDVYPVIFLDAMVLKVREGGTVQRKACYLALGVTVEGERDVLGMWFQEAEGAKFWMQVLSELKARRPGHPDLLRGRAQRASPRRSRRSSPRPPCKRASFISCATA